MDNSSSQKRKGCDCNCRNLTFQQLVRTPKDHLKCLLKKDIVKLCKFHGIDFKSWEAKSTLIYYIEHKLNEKEVSLSNMCNFPVYFSYKFKWSSDYICKLEDVIYPDEEYEISASVKELEKIIISQYRPTGIEMKYEDITNILYEENFPEADDQVIINSNNESQWKTSTLKLNFLMNELKRLGADKHDTYSCIIDLHQDIEIPHHDEIDKENAGIPSVLTNPT